MQVHTVKLRSWPEASSEKQVLMQGHSFNTCCFGEHRSGLHLHPAWLLTNANA